MSTKPKSSVKSGVKSSVTSTAATAAAVQTRAPKRASAEIQAIMGRARFLKPSTDFTFKRVFGEHKNLCKCLLNALLPMGETDPIVDIEYLPPEQVPDIEGGKNSIVDVRCKDTRGRTFLVEMQLHWNEGFIKRVTLNASKAFTRQAVKGMDYEDLQPVYALCFLDAEAKFFKDFPEDCFHRYVFTNTEHTDSRLDVMEMFFVEFPKFRSGKWMTQELANLWLRYFTEVDEDMQTVPPEFLQQDAIREALCYLEKSSLTEAELHRYEMDLQNEELERTYVRDEIKRNREEAHEEGLKQGLKQGVAKGLKKGVAKGLKKGLAEGLKKGLAEGLAEGEAKKNIENVRKFKQLGVPAETIAQATGLTREDIARL